MYSSIFNQVPRKRRKVATINAGTNILSLPDELLQQIFSNLSTDDRLPLGFSCKRFRKADMDLGCKNFEEISITAVRICDGSQNIVFYA